MNIIGLILVYGILLWVGIYFIEKAKKLSSEALTLFNKNKLNEAITKWEEAISQYEKAKEIAEIKEDDGNNKLNKQKYQSVN